MVDREFALRGIRYRYDGAITLPENIPVKLLIKISGQINSRELWEHIQDYEVNLTDFIDFTYIYGEVTYDVALKVIAVSALFGNINVQLSSGGQK